MMHPHFHKVEQQLQKQFLEMVEECKKNTNLEPILKSNFKEDMMLGMLDMAITAQAIPEFRVYYWYGKAWTAKQNSYKTS